MAWVTEVIAKLRFGSKFALLKVAAILRKLPMAFIGYVNLRRTPPLSKSSNFKLNPSFATTSNEVIKFFYPSLCLHCKEDTGKLRTPLCPLCTELLELVTPLGRCKRCFQKEDAYLVCLECRKKTPYFHKHYSACVDFGPGRNLCEEYRRGNLGLAEALSAYMVYQYMSLEEQLPDVLIPLVGSFWSKVSMGEDLNLFLAKKVGKLLNVPVCAALQYHWEEKGARFSLKKNKALADKKVLLISSRFVRFDIESAAFAVRQGFAKEIHSLSFI